jgi:hypothetical protein
VTAGLRPPLAFLDDDPILDDLGSAAAFARWVAEGLESTYLDASGALRRPPLADLLADASDTSLAAAHVVHGYTITEIARHLSASRSRISRRLKTLAPPARMGSDPDRARLQPAPVTSARVAIGV